VCAKLRYSDHPPALVRVQGGPHNVARTHPDEVNSAPLELIDMG
jgi:hypothetical protein